MKIRKGFVSNSSSSSFVCDVSGNIESGWDLSLEDAYMFECVNGHTFGDDYLVDKEEYMKNDDGGGDYRWEVPAKHCPICTMEYIMESDAIKYLLKKSNTTMKDVMSEISDKYGSYQELTKSIEDIKGAMDV